MSDTAPMKYDADFEALNEASRWLNHINLRRHRGNDAVRAAVREARKAVEEASWTLLALEQDETKS